MINLTTRTIAALPADMRDEIREQLEQAPDHGKLMLTVDIEAQAATQRRVQVAFREAAAGPGAGFLCVSLTGQAQAVRSSRCPALAGNAPQAETLGLKFSVASGQVSARVTNAPDLLHGTLQLGSLSKLVVVLAAVASGVSADTLVCPRSARDGKRQLRRETIPHHGFTGCDGGIHAIPFEQAIAASDGLATYDLARQLGHDRLLDALSALGLPTETSTGLDYELAFGITAANITPLTEAMQALFAVAYGVKVSAAPHLLQHRSTLNRRVNRVADLVPTSEQRSQLRRLLQAPVKHSMGSMQVWSDVASAGKSATNQSPLRDVTNRRFMASRLWLLYQEREQALSLFIVTTATPAIPLGLHQLSAQTFNQPVRALVAAASPRT